MSESELIGTESQVTCTHCFIMVMLETRGWMDGRVDGWMNRGGDGKERKRREELELELDEPAKQPRRLAVPVPPPRRALSERPGRGGYGEPHGLNGIQALRRASEIIVVMLPNCTLIAKAKPR